MRSENQSVNVLGEPLKSCCQDPLTGFYRTGFCETGPHDHGRHTVCAVVTEEFLSYTKEQGNDLSTPRTEFGFPGLRAGDRWCLCASRWHQAYQAGVAPPVVLESTEVSTLKTVPKEVLFEKRFSSEGG